MVQSRVFYIEYCQGCDRHKFCTKHNEAKYYEYFVQVKEELELEFPGCRCEEKKGKPRVGAFEVTSGEGRVYFSKLSTRLFPGRGIFARLINAVDELDENPSLVQSLNIGDTQQRPQSSKSPGRYGGNDGGGGNRQFSPRGAARPHSAGPRSSSPLQAAAMALRASTPDGRGAEEDHAQMTFAEAQYRVQQNKRVNLLKFSHDSYRCYHTPNAPTPKSQQMLKKAEGKPQKYVHTVEKRSNTGMSFSTDPYYKYKTRNAQIQTNQSAPGSRAGGSRPQSPTAQFRSQPQSRTWSQPPSPSPERRPLQSPGSSLRSSSPHATSRPPGLPRGASSPHPRDDTAEF